MTAYDDKLATHTQLPVLCWSSAFVLCGLLCSCWYLACLPCV